MNDDIRGVLLEAVNAGGAIIEQYFQGVFKIENKDDWWYPVYMGRDNG